MKRKTNDEGTKSGEQATSRKLAKAPPVEAKSCVCSELGKCLYHYPDPFTSGSKKPKRALDGSLSSRISEPKFNESIPRGSKETVDEILHNLWIKAELFQHQLEKNMAIDIRRPDVAKAEAKSSIERLLQEAEKNGRRIQAEATLDKWKGSDPTEDHLFTEFLHGQVEVWQWENKELSK